MSPPDINQQDGATGFLAFHEDELRAQALTGQRSGRAAIRPFMPDQHRAFFALLPTLFTATVDDRGWPMASVLTGERGFVQSPDPATLRIAAHPVAGDPAAPGFAVGAEVGLLGLDFTTRRRNRANGRLTAVDDGLTVRIAQSFGNCAQYIQTRAPTPRAATPAATENLGDLDDAARAMIASSDTFFVASRSRPEVGAAGGLDMSHRGGRPGFVGVQGDTLAIPDFRGNRFYNTLGNLLGDPRAGLIFIDFASGDLLQLQGTVTIDWHPDGGPPGAERLWRVRVERAWRRRGGLPFAWSFGDYAPTTLATGVW
jgi:predicted pyridoxine 5'-phosphate oxidase superfamily flavin-nucleotide-binding protein